MARREDFLARYSQAAQLAEEREQKLTTAEFMLASNPGQHEVKFRQKVFNPDTSKYETREAVYYSQYNSPASAGRAFRKIRSGETSGRNVLGRGEQYAYANKKGELGWKLAEPRGGVQEGLWKVIVHFDGTYTNGKEFHDEQKSFIVESSRYNNYYDAKSVEYETGEEIDKHMAEWAMNPGYGYASHSVTYIEVIRVQYTTKNEADIVSIE
jgi:hypothetical protein